MLYTVTHAPPRIVMADERKKIRLKDAAALLGFKVQYLSRIAKKDGKLSKDGVEVMRPYDDVVEFYEDELLAWFHEKHTPRRSKKN